MAPVLITKKVILDQGEGKSFSDSSQEIAMVDGRCENGNVC